MGRFIRKAVTAVVVLFLAQGLAWGQYPPILISWADANGSHEEPLNWEQNPDYGHPLGVDPEFVWYGELDITMETTDPIVFTASGNFKAAYGEIWRHVRVLQNVTNDTACSWSEFHLEALPSPDSPADFYKVWSPPTGWDAALNFEFCDFDATAPQYYINPGEVFVDGVVIEVWGDIDEGTGEGSFTITKQPTCVIPEAGSLAALLGGVAGLAVFFKRRRA